MNIELIKSELDRLSHLVHSWQEGEPVPAIERDMALDKLKSIYDILRFGPLATEAAAPAVADTAPAAVETATDDAGNDGEAAAADMPQANAGYESTEDKDAGDVEVELIFAGDEDTEENETWQTVPGYDSPEESGNAGPAAPAAEEQAVEELVAEELITEETAAAEPITEEPAVAEPAPENMPEPAIAAEHAREITTEPESVSEIPAVAPAPPAEQPAVTAAEPSQPTRPAPAAEPVIARPAQTDGPAVAESHAGEIQATAPAAHEGSLRTEPAAVNPETGNTPQPARRPMNSLFGADDEIHNRPRTKHHRMMSIYNDAQPRPEKVVDISKIFEMDIDEPMFGRNDESRQPAFVPGAAAQPTAPAHETASAETMRSETAVKASGTARTAAEQQNVTLGDTIGANTQTLADTLGKPSALAEEITHTKIDSLRQAIGINDKFLMIRDLFDGDGEAYEKAIGALDSFDSLDDCMIHIVENYAWNPDSQGAKFIMRLLERKLS